MVAIIIVNCNDYTDIDDGVMMDECRESKMLREVLTEYPSYSITVSGDIGHKMAGEDTLGVRVFCESIDDVIVDEQRNELTIVMCAADLNFPLKDLLEETVNTVVDEAISAHINDKGVISSTKMLGKRLKRNMLKGIQARLNQ